MKRILLRRFTTAFYFALYIASGAVLFANNGDFTPRYPSVIDAAIQWCIYRFRSKHLFHRIHIH